ncbi:MAG: signal peptidase II [Oscillospiraceae bacterium]|nr:signal peptidase II [Oscillospiraceae bacterium]
MIFVWMGLFAAGIVVLDQLSKYWTVQNISPWLCNNLNACTEHIEKLIQADWIPSGVSLPKSVPGIEGLFELIQVHNTGAAWSSFSGQIWLFAVIFIAFGGFLIWEFITGKMGFSQFERWCLVAVFAGGLGNMIDRIRFGFVVDMIHLQFMDFPVFNVADCFICCGCIALLVSLFFFNKGFWKETKKEEETCN